MPHSVHAGLVRHGVVPVGTHPPPRIQAAAVSVGHPDAHQAVIDPLLPDPAWRAGAGGRPEAHCRRQLVDAIFDMVDHGLRWRVLPAEVPP